MSWGYSRNISHKGLRFDGGVPFSYNGTDLVQNTDENKVVKVAANYRVAKCDDGEDFDGVAIVINNEMCAVQEQGYVTLPYTGDTAPSVGRDNLAANATGGVKVKRYEAAEGEEPEVLAAREYLVTAVDTTDNLVTFKIG